MTSWVGLGEADKVGARRRLTARQNAGARGGGVFPNPPRAHVPSPPHLPGTDAELPPPLAVQKGEVPGSRKAPPPTCSPHLGTPSSRFFPQLLPLLHSRKE